MKMRCLSCGIEKDTSILEVYGDGLTRDPPLFAIDCEGDDSRMAIVCQTCWHRLKPDMWISDSCWLGLNPVTPFDQLPRPSAENNKRFDVETYGG